MKNNKIITFGLVGMVIALAVTFIIRGEIVSAQDGKNGISDSLLKEAIISIKGNQDVNDISVLTYEPSISRPTGKRNAIIKPPLQPRALSPAATMTQTVEIEPNGTAATATPIVGPNVKVRQANLFPNGDIDFYSFTATAGDRVYAGTMTSFSAGSSTDSQLTLLASDGTTVIEFDDDNGSFAGLSSSIAGAIIPTTGTYYLKVNDFTPGTASERPYDLYVQVQTAAPTPETEPNDTPATANVLPASGHVSGTRDPALATEQDWYSFSANAGDTVVLSLDLNPERDTTVWNGRLGVALFGDAANQILVVDDAGTGDVTPVPNNPSEFMVMTVKTTGTYFAFVDSATAAVGGPTATYDLSVSILPRTPAGINCTTYTSTDVPKVIGPAAGLVSSTLTIPGNPRIETLRLNLTMDHALFADNDVHLRSPNDNDNGIFTDIGASATGGQQMFDGFIDDDNGLPPAFTAFKGTALKPELNYRLKWVYGENAGGTWTLDIRDDTTNASGGNLTAWGLEVCEQPAPAGNVIYSENFEAGAGGYTHSGTADEWELGLPATVATTTANPVAAFNTCNSGVSCWKTDLDNTYNVSSNQDLVSPVLNLTQYQGNLTLYWSMRYQIESANFDHANVQITEVGNPTNTRVLWQFLDATMTDVPGNPAVNVPASAGWGNYRADISDFAGKVVQITFHLDSDTTVNLGGMAIDDVSIRNVSVVAASVPVSGRVLTANGMPIANVKVTLDDATGNPRATYTNPFGYYSFSDVQAGRTYSLSASAKRYRFNPVIVTVGDEITGLDIVANPGE